MKKVGVLVLAIMFLFVGIGFTSAELTEEEAVSKAYECLQDTIDTRSCSRLSLEEQVWALLVSGDCKDEVMAAAQNEDECWPRNNCDLRLTSLVSLALNNLDMDTNNSETWLLSQKKIPDILWYLEIEAKNSTTCSIFHEGTKHYTATIEEDKTVSLDNTVCLEVAEGEYWLRIKKECYDKEFEISCQEDFLTTLLFQKKDSSTIYVLDEVHSSASGGTTVENIDSFCFSKGGSCNYEGSLWASIVLNYLGNDVSNFLPYLIIGKSEHQRFLPQSFLYMLTGGLEYRTEILQKQINSQYWRVNQDKYYDTALALLPFQDEILEEKDFSKEWILQNQEENGCWDDSSVKNTAFILYSLWPGEGGITNITTTDCIEAGYSCVEDDECNGTLMSSYTCTGGKVCCKDTGAVHGDDDTCEEMGYFCMSAGNCQSSILSYDCSGLSVCCEEEYEEETCSSIGGLVCGDQQYCKDGEVRYTNDLSYGESCCVNGACEKEETPVEEYTCEANLGTCELYECSSGYSESFSYTCSGGDICCMKDTTKKKSYWWVWLLFILIILVIVAIIFRDKIKEMIDKVERSKRGPPKASGMKRPPSYPPSYTRRPMMPPQQKRIIPPNQRPPVGRPAPKKSPKELDDVLKKLKDMSK